MEIHVLFLGSPTKSSHCSIDIVTPFFIPLNWRYLSYFSFILLKTLLLFLVSITHISITRILTYTHTRSVCHAIQDHIFLADKCVLSRKLIKPFYLEIDFSTTLFFLSPCSNIYNIQSTTAVSLKSIVRCDLNLLKECKKEKYNFYYMYFLFFF